MGEDLARETTCGEGARETSNAIPLTLRHRLLTGGCGPPDEVIPSPLLRAPSVALPHLWLRLYPCSVDDVPRLRAREIALRETVAPRRVVLLLAVHGHQEGEGIGEQRR